MKKCLTTILILCLCPLLQFGTGSTKTPRVGLIRFSVNVFDEQKAVVESVRSELEKSFRETIKNKFGKGPYFAADEYVITYANAEAPPVTIKPVIKPKTKENLKKLCNPQTGNKLDAIVFGHFEEEDKLIVKFRYYLDKDEKIISLKPIEIDVDNLKQKSQRDAFLKDAKSLKEKLIKELNDHFKPKTKKPEDQKKKSSAIKSSGYKPTEILIAKDVYRMIIDNGFYCHFVPGSPFHEEAIKELRKDGIRVPTGSIFKDERIVTAVRDNNGFLKTQSIHRTKKDNEQIELLWYPKPNEYTFNETVSAVEKLNSKDKNKNWRIPTIKELFSIVDENTNNHFHQAFKFPKNKTLRFWTSSGLKTEGTALNHIKEKAHLVVESVYSKRKSKYGQLRFSFEKIDARSNKKALLLPVYSDKIYTAKPVEKKRVTASNDKIPGFDGTSEDKPNAKPPVTRSQPSPTHDKIPGFDDVTSPPQKTGKKKIHSQKKRTNTGAAGFDSIPANKQKGPAKFKMNPSRTIRIALFPYLWKGMVDTVREQELNDIVYEIEKKLENLKPELKRNLNCELIINRKDSSNKHDISEIDKFYNIISDSSLTKRLKFNKIYTEFMNPGIDIIITVNYENIDPTSDINIFHPFIISAIDHQIYSNHLLQNRDPLNKLREYVTDKIRKIVYSNF